MGRTAIVALLLSCTLLVVTFAAPLEDENQQWNVNRNPEHIPKNYYGEWKGHTYMPSPADWRQIPVYQLITDRFADGIPENNEGRYGGYNLYEVGFRHGGDFKGLTSKLDYVKSLGYKAIWVSPVFQNMENSYHGYAQIDFTLLDDRFGTVEEFRELTDEAHKRGLYVIVDIVVNHMADLFYFEGHRGESAPFRLHDGEYRLFPHNPDRVYRDFIVNNTWDPFGFNGEVYTDNGYPTTESGRGSFSYSDFHHNGDLGNYGDAWQNHMGKIYGVMDDLRNDHPRVQEKLIAMTNALIATVDIDGIRMDTPMQVPLSFFQKWSPAVRQFAKSLGKDNFFMFAEFFCTMARSATMTGRGKTPDHYGKDQFIGPEFTFDGGIFYPLYWWFNQAIKDQQSGHNNEILSVFKDAVSKYDFYNPVKKEVRYSHLHFYNNHDQWRMSAATDGFAKTDLGTAIISLFPGIPLFYSGDEQGFFTVGTALDGWSREDMVTSLAWRKYPTVGGKNPADDDNFDQTNPHFLWTQKLNNIRRQYSDALETCDTIHERWSQEKNANGIFSFSRGCGDLSNWVLVMWNTWRDSLLAGGHMGAFYTGWRQGDVIVNLLNPAERITLASDGRIEEIWVGGYETKIFVLERNFRPLNPVVQYISPKHDSVIGQQDPLNVRIQFSEAMDQDSLMQAVKFNGVQIPRERLYYDSSSNTLNFTMGVIPDGIHYVEISEGIVRATSGKLMHGTFKSRVRKGSSLNVIVNPLLGEDSSLAEVVDPQQGLIVLHHKAAGAQKFRVKTDNTDWSRWEGYLETTSIHSPGARIVTVQYWADMSAAYYVTCNIATTKKRINFQ